MLPLEGIKVLDLSHAAAGPCCTMLLADMGADVVKLEPPNGELFRYVGGGMLFANVNRNKRGIAVDVRTGPGRDIALKLAATADILVENFTPGTVDRLGLDYNTISKINPRIIYCSVSGFGQTGPYRERPGYDPLAQAMSGMMMTTGEPQGAPVRTSASTVDFGTGILAAYAIAIALWQRQKTGSGQMIDAALLDTAIFYTTHLVNHWLRSGKLPQRLGSGNIGFAPNQAFETSDGFIFIAVTTEKSWHSFCQTLGMEELIDDPRFATNADRMQHRDQLVEILQPVIKQFAARELETKLLAVDIPCAPLLNVDGVVSDPQVIARGILVDTIYPDKGRLKLTRHPVLFSRTQPEIRCRAPLLGEHTAAVLEELGYSPAEISQLAARGIIFQHSQHTDGGSHEDVQQKG